MQKPLFIIEDHHTFPFSLSPTTLPLGMVFRQVPQWLRPILFNIVSLISREPQPFNSFGWSFRGEQGELLAISNLFLISMCKCALYQHSISLVGQNVSRLCPTWLYSCGVLSFSSTPSCAPVTFYYCQPLWYIQACLLISLNVNIYTRWQHYQQVQRQHPYTIVSAADPVPVHGVILNSNSFVSCWDFTDI